MGLLFALPAVAQPPPPASLPADTLDFLHDLRNQRDFEEALSRLTALKQRHPDNADVLWRRALILTDLGKVAEDEDKALDHYYRALEDANAALSLDSTSAWPHAIKALTEGRICLHAGNRERARRSSAVKQHAERALAIDSSMALPYHILGHWHRDVSDLNFVQRTIVKTVYGGLPDASFDRSVENLKRSIELDAHSYNHVELAKTYLQMDEDEKALEQLHRALKASSSPLAPEYKEEAGQLLMENR